VIVGLASAYGRKLHAARRALRRWFRGESGPPRETCHTLDEVLGWMAEDGLEFVNSIPRPGRRSVAPGENLFTPQSAGSRLGRVLGQLAAVGSAYREGWSFIVISRRKGGAAS
jgi:hypothetical protein